MRSHRTLERRINRIVAEARGSGLDSTLIIGCLKAKISDIEELDRRRVAVEEKRKERIRSESIQERDKQIATAWSKIDPSLKERFHRIAKQIGFPNGESVFTLKYQHENCEPLPFDGAFVKLYKHIESLINDST